MVSFVMVMFDELVDELAYMSLAKRDHATETLLFDRADEPLGIGVEIGTLRWQPNRLDTATRQDLAEDTRVQGSRSWIRWDAVRRQPSTGSVRLRASCSIHAPYGCGWIPAMVTRRVSSSITKKTRYRLRPASVSTSTVNRSQAARPSQCACKNAFHGVRRARSGAGSIPWSCRIRLTVFRAMSWPRFASAPRMRVYPHGGFSTATRQDHEVGHLAWRYRPTSTSAGAAVVLPGNQPPVPAENRVRHDDAGDLRQNPPAEFLASHRESTALGVGQAKWTWAKLLPEDPILLPEIIDHVFLVAVHPASGCEYEEAQSVWHSLRLLREQPLAPTLFRRFANLGRFVAPYGVDAPVPGYPKRPVPRDEDAAKALRKRTLTNLYNARPQWLADAHDALDAAVAAAYGWSATISDDDVLRELLALNGGDL